MTRNRILIWIIVILAATNIATVVTVLRSSADIRQTEAEYNAGETDARVMLFQEYLELDGEQMDAFVQLNRSFSQNANRTTSRLDALRRNMIAELSRDNPDMNRVDEIAGEIGSLHEELKHSTSGYYLELKELCNPEQQERLREMFMVMSDPEGDIMNLRRGRGNMRPGRGRNTRGYGYGRGRDTLRDEY